MVAIVGSISIFSSLISFGTIKADNNTQSSKFNTENVVNNASQAKSELETNNAD